MNRMVPVPRVRSGSAAGRRKFTSGPWRDSTRQAAPRSAFAHHPVDAPGLAKCRPSALRQQGQALTEFLVIAVALLPLFLLIPVIGKYQDIAHATQLASRYAAFDVLVRYGAVEGSNNPIKETSQLQNEVRRRFFSSSDAPIKTDDTAGDFKAHQNPFWRTPDDQSLIRDFADVTVERTTQSSHDGNSAGSKSGPFNPEFGATGIRSATVSVKLANLPSGLTFYEPFDKIDLVISRGTSVLADGWTGSNPEDVENRFKGLVPATVLLAPWKRDVAIGVKLVEIGVPPPRLGELEFWRDDVHPDRLRRP